MGANNEINSIFPFPGSKIIKIEETLQQTLTSFKELVIDLEGLHTENKNYRNMYMSLKERSESKTCYSCEGLKKNVANKEQVLESIVSALNKLAATRDFNIIDAIFRIINNDTSILTPPSENMSNEDSGNKQDYSSPMKEGIPNDIYKDESLSEIDGTPTGRKSPIILSKKFKNNSTNSLTSDKKKCPDDWSTPEKKAIKLTYPTTTRTRTSGRLKQSRLNLVKMKTCSIVDLTCSPETGRTDNDDNLQSYIKKEILDNDDTILPSPTSGPIQMPVYKSITKDSPSKFKKPVIASKIKMEVEKNDRDEENIPLIDETHINVDSSINLLKHYPNRFKSPIKVSVLENESHCADESISLLQHVKMIEEKNNKINSPNKRPLEENMNLRNTQKLPETQSSISILQQDMKTEVKNDIFKRTKNIVPVYKELSLRKKAEKRALPGWSCEECKNFYDELYKDDLEMLAKRMDECSKHRGKTNPLRPKTPDGFWNPRWDVPDNTEQFNLRNNAL